jgi:hypothetical protein
MRSRALRPVWARCIGVAAAALAAQAAAAVLDDGEYRCDAASDTTAEFVYLTIDDGKLGAFELVAVNRLRADVCQLSLSHFDGEVHPQKNGWRIDVSNGAQNCRATLTRSGSSLVVTVAGEGCRTLCGGPSQFWQLRYDLPTHRCTIR